MIRVLYCKNVHNCFTVMAVMSCKNQHMLEILHKISQWLGSHMSTELELSQAVLILTEEYTWLVKAQAPYTYVSNQVHTCMLCSFLMCVRVLVYLEIFICTVVRKVSHVNILHKNIFVVLGCLK